MTVMPKASKEIEAILKPYNADVKRHITRLVKRSDEDIKRYTGALREEFKGQVKAVAEQYGGLNEKIDKIHGTLYSHTKTLDSHTEMIGKLMVNTEVIKTNVEFLKGSMKKKVDYDEFLALERRMSLLESKVK